MGKKWLLRLPKDLDDWLTLRAAQETVSRGKKISKNTLIIELVTTFKHADLPDPEAELTGGESWQDAKSAPKRTGISPSPFIFSGGRDRS
ncbi:MAG: hypothetical protein P8017_11455 [Deltaproteobacteria bacterium]